MPRGGGGHHGGGHAGGHAGGGHTHHHAHAHFGRGGGGGGEIDLSGIPPEMRRIIFVLALAKFIGACVLFYEYGIPQHSFPHKNAIFVFNVILFALPNCVPFFSAVYMLVCMGLDGVGTSLALEVGVCFLAADLCIFAIPCCIIPFFECVFQCFESCCHSCLYRFTATKSPAMHDVEESSFMIKEEGAVVAEASYQSSGPSSSLVGVI